MNGIPSTKMGGASSPELRYGDHQRSFRYYKLTIPGGRSGLLPGMGINNKLTSVSLYHLYFTDMVNGNNLMDSTVVTVHSNAHTKVYIDSWLVSRRGNSVGSSAYLELLYGMDTEFIIDFNRSVHIEEYGVCLRNNIVGWRLEGSRDGNQWQLLNDISPFTESVERGGLIAAAQWYYTSPYSSILIPKYDRPYKYWGIILGESSQDWLDPTYGYTSYNIRMYEIAFLDSIGGVDISVGGISGSVITPASGDTYIGLFDKDYTNYNDCLRGNGVSYEFPSPVSPKAFTITSTGVYRRPMKMLVMCADTPYNWVVAKNIWADITTWDEAVVTTKEFII